MDNLDVETRVQQLNDRLVLAADIIELARSYTESRQGKNLEVTIIVLIAVEVLIYFLDKSEWWRLWTWEQLLGLERPSEETILAAKGAGGEHSRH